MLEPPRKVGRPTKHTPELEAALLEWLCSGQTLRSFCRQHDVSRTQVHEWRKLVPGFDDRYWTAKKLGYEELGDEMLDVSAATQEGSTTTSKTVVIEGEDGEQVPAKEVTVKTEDMLGHRKLRIDTIEKWLKVWFPEQWKAKLDVDHKSGGKTFAELLRSVLGDDKEEAGA